MQAFFEFKFSELCIKGVLNPNFRPCSFELKKVRFFKMNFDLGFRVLLTSETEDI